MIRRCLSVNGNKVIEMYGAPGQIIDWNAYPGQGIVVGAFDRVEGTGTISLAEYANSDGTRTITSVRWLPETRSVDQIIDEAARNLAAGHPA